MPATTFAEVLERQAEQQPDRVAYRFESDDGERTVAVTYAELDVEARAIAAAIRAEAPAGARALLLYPPGREYVAGLWGCLYAGVVAVPAYPPDPARAARTIPRLTAILRDSEAQTVLTTAAIAEGAGALFDAAGSPGLRFVATDASPAGAGAPAPPRDVHATAILQYTSGSTADPRGVMLSHANLLDNSACIHEAFGHTPRSTGVLWLPPYHDMGLIGGVLQPVYGGFPAVLISPLVFLRRPLRWLRAISAHGGTTAGGPNFAFDLCVRRTSEEQRAELDLSTWEIAFNGAEPIRRETVDAFAEAFAGCGFRREAFYPCYGLAEATLMVTGARRLTGVRTLDVDRRALEEEARVEPREPGAAARAVAGCGRTRRDHEVAIVDPVTCARSAPGRVGEIWVRGSSVARGYWGDAARSEAAFGGRLAGEAGGRWLRTGDLGFLDDGELFVTGRIKELIIVGGRNHYPTDVELACERSVSGVRRNCGAAFGVQRDGREHVAVVYEVADDVDEPFAVIDAIRAAVARELELQVGEVTLIPSRTLPKTSSGKVQRGRCRAMLEAGELDVVAAWSLAEEAMAR
jgi:acyl-CoA synthetase (AMP-forming)/AMP-acid ligase II